MPQYTITFQPGGQQVQVDEGTTLLQAQIMAGLKPDAPCGGHGTCKKCTVRLADGREVLACQTQVHQDDTVYPAQAEKAQILTTSSHTALPSLWHDWRCACQCQQPQPPAPIWSGRDISLTGGAGGRRRFFAPVRDRRLG